MKDRYERVEMEIVEFESHDVIRTSTDEDETEPL